MEKDSADSQDASPEDNLSSSDASALSTEATASPSSDVVPFPYEGLMKATPGLSTLKQMLASVPRVKKAAYAEAVHRCPEIMLDECNPVAFLKREKYNTLAAAQRIVNYWTARLQIFGERAFMPMNISSKGALGHEEVEVIRTGFIAVLPPDKMGHPVLLIDLSKVGKDVRDESIQRALFYMSSFVSQNPIAQQGGINVLCVHNQQFKKYLSMMKTTSQMLDGASTIKVKQVFGIALGVERSIFVQMAEWTAPLFSDESITLVGGDSPDEVCEKMAKYNIGMESLPQSLGGYWVAKNFHSWFKLQASVGPTNSFTKLGFQIALDAQDSVVSQSKRMGGNSASSPAEESTNFADPAPSSSQAVSDALAALDEAILMLPDEEKAGYIRAKKEAPTLVEKESNPILYLRFSKYNTWDAAKRLVRYWKERVYYFKERAFLPMNQTGEGALSRKDVSVMSTGYWAALPSDSEGHAVIFGDAARRGKHKDPDMLIRHLFYWNHCILSEQPVEKGVVVLVYVHKAAKAITSPELKARMQLASDCMLMWVHSLHVVPKVSRRSILDEVLPIIFNLFPKSKTKRYCHRCKTNDEILSILEQHKLQRRDLPEIIGGDWSYENFVTWQERRIRIEWELPLGVLGEEGDDFSAKALSELTEDERRERKRRYNILHSRRKRRRDRLETDVLETQIEELKEERSRILAEYDRLRRLQMQAKQTLQQSGFVIFQAPDQTVQEQQIPISRPGMAMNMPMQHQLYTSSQMGMPMVAQPPIHENFLDQIEPNNVLQNKFNNFQSAQNVHSQQSSGIGGMTMKNNLGYQQQQQAPQHSFTSNAQSMTPGMVDYSLPATAGPSNIFPNQNTGNNMEQQQTQMIALQHAMNQQQSMGNDNLQVVNQEPINSTPQSIMGQTEHHLLNQQSQYNGFSGIPCNQQFIPHQNHQQNHPEISNGFMGSPQMFSAQANQMNAMAPNSNQFFSQQNQMNSNMNFMNAMNVNSYNPTLHQNQQQQMNQQDLHFNDKFSSNQGFSF